MISIEKVKVEKQKNMAKLFEDIAVLRTPICENCVEEDIIVFPEKQGYSLTKSIISSSIESFVTSLLVLLSL